MSTVLTALSTAVGHVSRRSGDLILGVTRLLLNSISGTGGGEEASAQSPISHVISQLPSTVRGTISRMNLDGQTTKYAVCPTCHCTYLSRLDRRSGLYNYPNTCTNVPTPGAAQCNTQITDEGNNPKKTFLYYNFKDYLAALFSRGDLEELMDNACDKFTDAYEARRSFDDWGRVTDIF